MHTITFAYTHAAMQTYTHIVCISCAYHFHNMFIPWAYHVHIIHTYAHMMYMVVPTWACLNTHNSFSVI